MRPDAEMAVTSGDGDGFIRFAGEWTVDEVESFTAAWPNVTVYPAPDRGAQVVALVLASLSGFIVGLLAGLVLWRLM